MKKTFLTLLLMTIMNLANAQQIYQDYRQMPSDTTCATLAQHLAQAGHIDKIAERVERVKTALLQKQDYESYAFITNEYGIYLYYRGQLQAFDELLSNSSEQILKLEEGHIERLIFLNFQSLILRIKGENLEAIQKLEAIKQEAETKDYPYFLKNCYNDLCTVYMQNSDFKNAFAIAQKVIGLSQPIEEDNNHLDIAALYTNLGLSLLSADPRLANSYLKQAVSLFEDHDKYHGQMSYRLMAMGGLERSYNSLRDYDNAIASSKRRLQLALDSLATGRVPLTSLAETYTDMYYTSFEASLYPQMKTIAKQYREFCLTQSSEIKTRQSINSIRLLGYAYTMNGELDSSLNLIKESIAQETSFYKTPYSGTMTQSYLYLADTHFQRHEYADAEKAYLNAIRCTLEDDSLLRRSNLHLVYRHETYNVIQALLHLQEVLYSAYQEDKHTNHLKSILHYNTLNEELMLLNHQISQNEESGLEFSKQLKQNNYYAIKASECLANTHHLKQYADTVFVLSEKTKLFHLKSNKAISAMLKTIPDSVIGNYLSLKKELANAQEEQLSSHYFDQQNTLFLSRLRLNSYFENIDIKAHDKISLECPDGQSYISYTLYDSTLYIAAINHKQSIIKSVNANTLRAKSRQFIRKIKSGADYKLEQEDLSKLLIAPIASIIKNQEHITIIPDSYLFNIPFELLVNEQNLLIEDYDVNYQYAYSRINAPQTTSYSLLAISPFAKKEGELSEELAELVRSNNDLDNLRGDKLTQLPYSGKEIKNISKIFSHQGLISNTLYGENASKENVIKALPQNTILHFATHGTSSSKKEETGLFLSPNTSISSDFLSLTELYQLELKGDLAVLSACKSGMGDIKEGEGILSLPRGFIYAGIPNIIASLWKVHDKKTKDLMVAFYQYLLKDKLSYSKALRKAKNDFINQGEAAMDWAGFILISD